jgi:hypothetical protein
MGEATEVKKVKFPSNPVFQETADPISENPVTAAEARAAESM